MNLFEVANYYINRISKSESRLKSTQNNLTQDHDVPKLKALLLDKNTVPTISVCTTQSELLSKDIYLIESIENRNRNTMRYVKCIVYVKPTEETMQLLIDELMNPKYAEYYIYFNNFVSKSQLERLAQADNLEVVVKVEEIFQDYQIFNDDLFSLDTPSNKLYSNQTLVWNEAGLENITNSLISLLLSLKLKPEIVFENNSKLAAKLAKEVSNEIDQNAKTLFDFPARDSKPLLVILDRKNDPLTPLLQPWTYQSMIKEYIGIKRNVVDLSNVPGIDKELAKVTLSPREDPFYKETMHLNFGDLGDKVKQYVSVYKDKTKSNSQIGSLEDIKNFIEKYPEFKKLSGNVAKHMSIVGELDRQLQTQDIWELSELEQNIAVHDNDETVTRQLFQLLLQPTEKLNNYYKMKLSCIYILRSCIGDANQQKFSSLINNLQNSGLSIEEINFVHHFHLMANDKGKLRKSNDSSNGNSDKKEKEDLLSELAKRFNSRMGRNDKKSGSTSNNVYMQHIPEISEFLTQLSQNSIHSSKKYSFISSEKDKKASNNYPIQDVVIFMVGGVTFEESRLVHEFNEAMKSSEGNIRLILGGTDILSTKDYLNSIND
ncbi:hypothetical protein TPHA_0J02140 [Tetrapisispora phaffii CBS 4417]|uniref:Uncharacterized protein n=1 Tax=Tetrapisispora phaffii (strain ATCC 24235 / CBS 4417 / NBRC 1672 / NRRL Y-8282 / UCD 70-5) TaxID=1071381 RepID=G8BYU2_TETPH|nr:hypothetical protein TPHA_0J02140 [Tetrapisispora phaffii CBS 4417]CCE65034.1 hypothetical protein TPHA_0J02140 [Tetrapisispora phaffii CBS 4417]